MGIGETLRRYLAKLVMRAAGDQMKTECENLQLCADLKAGIEGSTHVVGKRRIERVRARRIEEVEEDWASDEEEERGGMAVRINNLTMEMNYASWNS